MLELELLELELALLELELALLELVEPALVELELALLELDVALLELDVALLELELVEPALVELELLELALLELELELLELALLELELELPAVEGPLDEALDPGPPVMPPAPPDALPMPLVTSAHAPIAATGRTHRPCSLPIWPPYHASAPRSRVWRASVVWRGAAGMISLKRDGTIVMNDPKKGALIFHRK